MTESTVVHRALLPAAPPFSLAASLRAIAGFRPTYSENVLLGDRVRTALPWPGRSGGAVVVEVAPRPDAVAGVSLTVYAESPLTATEAASVRLAVSRWLGLDDDIRPFLALVADDPPVRDLLTEVAGLHQVRFATLPEAVA